MPETTETETEQAPPATGPRTFADLLALRRTWTIGFTALTVALIGFLVLGALVFPSPKGQGYAGSADITLTSVSMVSPDEGWASGTISGSPQAILMRYQRGVWTIVPKPSGLGVRAGVSQVDMVSATDGWALSTVEIPVSGKQDAFTPGGVILHYDGTAWTIAVPQTPAPLTGLSMDSAMDGWAVGGSGLLLHYDGHAWITVHDDGFASLGAVTLVDAISPHEVWVNAGSGLARYDGSHWSPVSIQDRAYTPTSRVTALTMISDREGWAISGAQLLRDQNGFWSVTNPPQLPAPGVLAVPAPGEVWVAGSANSTLMGYAHGQWRTVKSPLNDTLAAMTFVSPTEGWAVGQNGAILHYTGGAWKRDTNVSWDQAAYAAWSGQ